MFLASRHLSGALYDSVSSYGKCCSSFDGIQLSIPSLLVYVSYVECIVS